MRTFVHVIGLACLLAGCGGGGEESGGEAEVRKAFAEYDAAVKAGDLDGLKARVAGEKAAELEAPEAPQLLELAAQMRPAKARVVACKITGDRAELDLAGKSQGQSLKGTASMVREGGAWRLAQESWSLSIKLGSEAREAVVAPPMESMTADVRNRVAALASEDPAAGSAAFSELGTRYQSAASYLKDLRPAFWDERPVHFIIVEESFKGGGKSFRYHSSKLPTPGAAALRADSVGEALRYHLWRLEDASNSGSKGSFEEWWAGYAPSKHLPLFE
jgi:hypothetical protein